MLSKILGVGFQNCSKCRPSHSNSNDLSLIQSEFSSKYFHCNWRVNVPYSLRSNRLRQWLRPAWSWDKFRVGFWLSLVYLRKINPLSRSGYIYFFSFFTLTSIFLAVISREGRYLSILRPGHMTTFLRRAVPPLAETSPSRVSLCEYDELLRPNVKVRRNQLRESPRRGKAFTKNARSTGNSTGK